MAFFTIGANTVHKWAHADHHGSVLQFLQKYHIVLNPQHHQVHHTLPHDAYYCISCGWMNPVLRAINFWRGMERLLGALGFVNQRLAETDVGQAGSAIFLADRGGDDTSGLITHPRML